MSLDEHKQNKELYELAESALESEEHRTSSADIISAELSSPAAQARLRGLDLLLSSDPNQFGAAQFLADESYGSQLVDMLDDGNPEH